LKALTLSDVLNAQTEARKNVTMLALSNKKLKAFQKRFFGNKKRSKYMIDFAADETPVL
jgi:hypothetical protein